MQKTSPYGHPLAERGTDNVSTLAPWDVLTVAALKLLDSSLLSPGREESVRSLNGRKFYWSATSILTADDQLVIIPDDVTHPAAGRWLATPGQVVDLEFARTYATADAATLYTVPTGANLLVHRGYNENSVAWTGGTSSTTGMSSDQTGLTTKGDLQGGSSGDADAALTAADYILGTIGTDIAAGVILKAGSVVRHDRITSVHTAGVGKGHLVCTVLSNAGV